MNVLIVTNMYPSPDRPHWGGFVRSQVESLQRLGVATSLYEIEGWRSTWEYARALRNLPTVCRRLRPDLVHAHYGLSGAASLRVDAPLVVSFCGDDVLGSTGLNGRITVRSMILREFSFAAARRASAAIVKSEELRARLRGARVVDVIPNGVDLDVFVPRSRAAARASLGWPASKPILLFAGSPHEPVKNWPFAHEVALRLQERGRDVQLIAIAGRRQSEVVDAMNAADVLLLPSLHEGSPNVVKEAMAVGLPVVAAPVGDCVERLTDCWPGGVIERDPEAFVRAVEDVLDAGTRSNGRERIAPLELSAVARRVLGVYERVLVGAPQLASSRPQTRSAA
jgi:glycosyltransferase involved in cell wall biosynthesis